MELRFRLAWLLTADMKGASPSSVKMIPTVYGRYTGANRALVYCHGLSPAGDKAQDRSLSPPPRPCPGGMGRRKYKQKLMA